MGLKTIQTKPNLYKVNATQQVGRFGRCRRLGSQNRRNTIGSLGDRALPLNKYRPLNFIVLKLLQVSLLICMSVAASGQPYDILVKDGHVIDAKNEIDGIYDVAIKNDRIAAVEKDIPASDAELVVDASGLYVTPGLIDLHAHLFWGTNEGDYLMNSYSALPADGFTLQYGVTTAVDAGCSGWKSFETFKEQTIDRSKTRVKAFLNIVGEGMRGDPDEQDVSDMDPRLTAMRVFEFDEIVGIKVAHFKGPNWEPVRLAVEAGRLSNVPIMVDFGRSEPPLSIEQLFMEELRPGDIYTHCFAGVVGREPMVDENGILKPFMKAAVERGIIMDVGHGGGSFRWSVAIPALKQGLKPQTISTDLHTGSMNRGMKSQINVMSKFLNIGMSMQEVIEASTWKPAQVVHIEDELGHLSVGALADVAVIRELKGEFGFIDVAEKRMDGNRKLECELTILGGEVVWDLNGISKPAWDAEE